MLSALPLPPQDLPSEPAPPPYSPPAAEVPSTPEPVTPFPPSRPPVPPNSPPEPIVAAGGWPPSAARGCHPALNSPTDHVTQATPPGFPSRAPRHKTQLEADLRRTAGSTVRRDAGATQAYEDAADDRHAADTRLTLRTTGHGATGMGSDGAPAARQRPNRSRSRAARLWGAAPVV